MPHKGLLAVVVLSFLLSGCMGPATRTPTSPITTSPSPTAVALGKIAYIQAGGIWVKELPAGEPHQLATGSCQSPHWSTSGQWLAFLKDRHLWFVPGTGGAPFSPDDEEMWVLTWSPTEDLLAYQTTEGAVKIADPSTGHVVMLASGDLAPFSGQGIAWSPDGRWIAYRYKATDDYCSPATIRRISADGKEFVDLYTGHPSGISGSAFVMGWTTDGRFLLVQDDFCSASLPTDGAPLYALSTAGGELMLLAELVLPYHDYIVPAPHDTDQAAVSEGGLRDTWLGKQLWIVSASGTEETLLSPDDVVALSPSWSPGGRQIAYIAAPDAMEQLPSNWESADVQPYLMQRRLWVIDLDTSRSRQLTNDHAFRDERALWSAAGDYLLFARLTAEGAGSLWLVPSVGGIPERLLDLGPLDGRSQFYGHIAWGDLFDWWQESSEESSLP